MLLTHRKLFQANTNRYLFHVSLEENRKAILRNGLLLPFKCPQSTNKNNCIYAHNDDFPNSKWYPIFLNLWDIDNDHYFNEELNLPLFAFQYDYWQIDTKKANNIWYYHKTFDMPDYLAVKTFEPIKPTALKLYKLQFGKSVINEVVDGVATLNRNNLFKAENKF